MFTQPALSISMIDSRCKGAPTAVCRRAGGREFLLHSQWDPVEEGRFLVRDIPRRERALYVMLGFGLGYHVKALLQRIPANSHILVVEPDGACLSREYLGRVDSASKAWIQNDRLKFLALHDAHAAPMLLADHLARLRLLSLELYTHLPSSLTDEGFYRDLVEAIPRQLPVSLRSHLKLIEKTIANDLCNFWANLRCSWNAANLAGLAGRWPDRALVIVSSGPSLTDALPLLEQAKSRAFLLATAPAARILLAYRIRPDMVISVDPYVANLQHFEGWETDEVPLAYYHRIYRGILSRHRGPKLYFVMRDEPPLPLCRTAEVPGYLQGGSVAFSALQLAHSMKASPVIFVGQDFAFADGHTHATGSVTDRAFDVHTLPPEFFTVTGVDGRPVVTNRLYHSYLLYMQDYLMKFSKANPGVRHVNTSIRGARMRGMEYMPLNQVLADLPVLQASSATEILSSALQSFSPIPASMQKGALNQWEAEVASWLAGTDLANDFDRFYGKFKRSSFYAQASRSYEDVFYLYETEIRDSDVAAKSAFMNEFKEHLQGVLQDLHAAIAAC